VDLNPFDVGVYDPSVKVATEIPPPPAPVERTVMGRMTITWYDIPGVSQPIPEVSFDPIGRIQPAHVENILYGAISRAILMAQAEQKRKAAKA
jgi:hypothetical protein